MSQTRDEPFTYWRRGSGKAEAAGRARARSTAAAVHLGAGFVRHGDARSTDGDSDELPEDSPVQIADALDAWLARLP